MLETEKAYLAGLLDGEGCISISKTNETDYRNARHRLHIQIVNTNKEVLKWICTTTGIGVIHTRSKVRKGWKISHSWSCAEKQSKIILNEVLPYLQIKKVQATLAIDYLNNYKDLDKKDTNKQEELLRRDLFLEQLQKLNRKGTAHE